MNAPTPANDPTPATPASASASASASEPRIPFADERSIPQLGFGVWQVSNDEAADVVVTALEAGYRHIDTARGYRNEEGVGRALRAAGLPRDEVFVTSKCPNQDQGRDNALRSFDETMADLGLDVLDLYLIHWPTPEKGLAAETWQAFVELQEQGRIRSIGVSNFRPEDLALIEAETGVRPVLNQIELHPYFAQPELRAHHAELGIVTESWSPLGQGGGELADPVVTAVAEAHGASPAQVLIAWNLALGNVVIPKSVTPARIVENLAARDLRLSADEVARISALHRGPSGRQGGDPGSFAIAQGV
ncbi:aldo/keto reductase [Brachybacterium sp. DNPG3]